MTKTQYIKIIKYLENNNFRRRNVGSLGLRNGKLIINTRDVYFLDVMTWMTKNHIKFLKIERKAIGAISIYLSKPRKCCTEHMKERQAEMDKVINIG